MIHRRLKQRPGAPQTNFTSPRTRPLTPHVRHRRGGGGAGRGVRWHPTSHAAAVAAPPHCGRHGTSFGVVHRRTSSAWPERRFSPTSHTPPHPSPPAMDPGRPTSSGTSCQRRTASLGRSHPCLRSPGSVSSGMRRLLPSSPAGAGSWS